MKDISKLELRGLVIAAAGLTDEEASDHSTNNLCQAVFGVREESFSKIALALLALTETRFSENHGGYVHKFVVGDGPVQKVLISRVTDDNPNM